MNAMYRIITFISTSLSSWDFWNNLKISWSFYRFQEESGDFWRLLKNLGSFQRLLGESGGFFIIISKSILQRFSSSSWCHVSHCFFIIISKSILQRFSSSSWCHVSHCFFIIISKSIMIQSSKILIKFMVPCISLFLYYHFQIHYETVFKDSHQVHGAMYHIVSLLSFPNLLWYSLQRFSSCSWRHVSPLFFIIISKSIMKQSSKIIIKFMAPCITLFLDYHFQIYYETVFKDSHQVHGAMYLIVSLLSFPNLFFKDSHQVHGAMYHIVSLLSFPNLLWYSLQRFSSCSWRHVSPLFFIIISKSIMKQSSKILIKFMTPCITLFLYYHFQIYYETVFKDYHQVHGAMYYIISWLSFPNLLWNSLQRFSSSSWHHVLHYFFIIISKSIMIQSSKILIKFMAPCISSFLDYHFQIYYETVFKDSHHVHGAMYLLFSLLSFPNLLWNSLQRFSSHSWRHVSPLFLIIISKSIMKQSSKVLIKFMVPYITSFLYYHFQIYYDTVFKDSRQVHDAIYHIVSLLSFPNLLRYSLQRFSSHSWRHVLHRFFIIISKSIVKQSSKILITFMAPCITLFLYYHFQIYYETVFKDSHHIHGAMYHLFSVCYSNGCKSLLVSFFLENWEDVSKGHHVEFKRF